MNIEATLVKEFSLAALQVENTIKLIDEGNTIPFIARYRKEVTGSMDDQQLRELHERLLYLRNLEERKQTVQQSLIEQGKLSDELAAALTAAATLTEVEDIYRPFRPKRRTRATMAEEKGLAPLADILWAQDMQEPAEVAAAPFVDEEKGVENAQEAISGACDILAERISDDTGIRAWIRKLTWQEAFVNAARAKKADDEKKAGVYEMYYEFSEPVRKIVGHRVLALNRGEAEDCLKVSIEAPVDKILSEMAAKIVKKNPHSEVLIKSVISDSYKRLSAPAVERDIRNKLTEQAEEGAVKVFGENLRQLLMQPPVKDHMVLAIDPGFRTGCKWAVVDETGKVLETGLVFCTTTKDTAPSKKSLAQLIKKYSVELIAIGNGTASRETEQVVAELLRENELPAKYTIVNEAGASVYSASKLGAEEFPDFDVALRSAASIGRRLQDPLAELVKIDPKSIGVGQYQHDMNQKRLGETLEGVVESCVNAVGVDLNTASPSLLSYVAGISPAVSKHILAYREENGKFNSRRELLKVKKLGPKAFEQCAGFLRIPGAKNPMDNTGVHPESYAVAEKWLSYKKEGKKIEPAQLKSIAEQLSVGLPTLEDIIRELEKPGRDPREEFNTAPLFRSDVLSIEDLEEGMKLKGTVRNVIDFGAFVDIGVHQDGLVHISQLCDRYIKHPLEVVSVGDVVDVQVLAVDVGRKRISLGMKGV